MGKLNNNITLLMSTIIVFVDIGKVTIVFSNS